jgi:hypothetical protein
MKCGTGSQPSRRGAATAGPGPNQPALGNRIRLIAASVPPAARAACVMVWRSAVFFNW